LRVQAFSSTGPHLHALLLALVRSPARHQHQLPTVGLSAPVRAALQVPAWLGWRRGAACLLNFHARPCWAASAPGDAQPPVCSSCSGGIEPQALPQPLPCGSPALPTLLPLRQPERSLPQQRRQRHWHWRWAHLSLLQRASIAGGCCSLGCLCCGGCGSTGCGGGGEGSALGPACLPKGHSGTARAVQQHGSHHR